MQIDKSTEYCENTYEDTDLLEAYKYLIFSREGSKKLKALFPKAPPKVFEEDDLVQQLAMHAVETKFNEVNLKNPEQFIKITNNIRSILKDTGEAIKYLNQTITSFENGMVRITNVLSRTPEGADDHMTLLSHKKSTRVIIACLRDLLTSYEKQAQDEEPFNTIDETKLPNMSVEEELDNDQIARNLKLKAIELYRDNRIEESLETFAAAIDNNPNDDDCYFRMAVVLSENGFLKQAFWNYCKAIEINPDFAEAYYNRGHIRRMSFDVSGARVDFKFALEKGFAESREWINFAPNIANHNSLEAIIDTLSLNAQELEMETRELARNGDLIGALGAIQQAVNYYPKLTNLKTLKHQIEVRLGMH